MRAHDDRFDGTINKLGLGEDVSNHLEIIDGTASAEMKATTSVVEDVKNRKKREKVDKNGEDESESNESTEDEQLAFSLTDLSQAIKAKIVKKCGTRDYWETWAKDISKIAQDHITRINSIVLNLTQKKMKYSKNLLKN